MFLSIFSSFPYAVFWSSDTSLKANFAKGFVCILGQISLKTSKSGSLCTLFFFIPCWGSLQTLNVYQIWELSPPCFTKRWFWYCFPCANDETLMCSLYILISIILSHNLCNSGNFSLTNKSQNKYIYTTVLLALQTCKVAGWIKH